MDLLKWMDKQIDRVARVSMEIAVYCLFVMVLLINVEVLGRYFFNFSTLIADEYGAYLFAWCSFLGFAQSFRNGNFLRVDVFIKRLPHPYFKYFHLLACSLGFVFSVTITYEVAKLPYSNYIFGSNSTQPSNTPLFIPQLVLPIGMASMAIVFLNEIAGSLRKRVVSKSVGSGKEVG